MYIAEGYNAYFSFCRTKGGYSGEFDTHKNVCRAGGVVKGRGLYYCYMCYLN